MTNIKNLLVCYSQCYLLTYKDIAKHIGIPYTSFYRFLISGKSLNEKHLIKLINWLLK